jgi:hypothetical protein
LLLGIGGVSTVGGLALFPRVRPWLGLVTMHFGLMSLNDFLDSSVGMVTLHLFTFNPTSIHEF